MQTGPAQVGIDHEHAQPLARGEAPEREGDGALALAGQRRGHEHEPCGAFPGATDEHREQFPQRFRVARAGTLEDIVDGIELAQIARPQAGNRDRLDAAELARERGGRTEAPIAALEEIDRSESEREGCRDADREEDARVGKDGSEGRDRGRDHPGIGKLDLLAARSAFDTGEKGLIEPARPLHPALELPLALPRPRGVVHGATQPLELAGEASLPHPRLFDLGLEPRKQIALLARDLPLELRLFAPQPDDLRVAPTVETPQFRLATGELCAHRPQFAEKPAASFRERAVHCVAALDGASQTRELGLERRTLRLGDDVGALEGRELGGRLGEKVRILFTTALAEVGEAALGLDQLAFGALEPFVEPVRGALAELELGRKLLRDVGLGDGIGDPGRLLGIAAAIRDGDHPALAPPHHPQTREEGFDHRRHGIGGDRGGRSRHEFRIIRKVEPRDHPLGQGARAQHLDLAVDGGAVAVESARVHDLPGRRRRPRLDEDERFGDVDGRQQRGGEATQARSEEQEAEQQPAAAPEQPDEFNEVDVRLRIRRWGGELAGHERFRAGTGSEGEINRKLCHFKIISRKQRISPSKAGAGEWISAPKCPRRGGRSSHTLGGGRSVPCPRRRC